ncbi:MAG: YihY/virulence factor BrkB family protein [Patulibacter sp.]|nr:YihY/virulence factor BrkB family protein [Patulibacter sp.]
MLKRAVSTFLAQGMTDWAAVLAYNTIMAIVPVLLVGAALLTLLGSDTLPQTVADQFLSLVQNETSGSSADDTANAIRGLVDTALENAQGAAGVTLVISVLLALNGASGAFAAAGRALDRIHHVENGRGLIRGKLASIGLAAVVITLMASAATLVVVGGGIADSVFSWFGLEQQPAVWTILRIPLALVALLVAINVVFSYAPALPRRRMRLFSVGALTALAAWTIVSAFVVAYVQIAGFGSAYGALGGAIVLLFWLYLSSATFLFGAEVDAEAERTALMHDGEPPALHGPSSDAA